MTTDNLQSLTEQITIEVRAINEYAGQVEKSAEASREFDTKLREREKKLNEREEKVGDREKKVQEQEDRVDEKLDSIKEKEVVISKLDEKKTEVEAKIAELTDTQVQVNKDKEALEEKIKEYDFLKKKEKELTHRESLMAKETLIDAERKEKLDRREEELKKEARRLQGIANSMSLKGK